MYFISILIAIFSSSFHIIPLNVKNGNEWKFIQFLCSTQYPAESHKYEFQCVNKIWTSVQLHSQFKAHIYWIHCSHNYIVYMSFIHSFYFIESVVWNWPKPIFFQIQKWVSRLENNSIKSNTKILFLSHSYLILVVVRVVMCKISKNLIKLNTNSINWVEQRPHCLIN